MNKAKELNKMAKAVKKVKKELKKEKKEQKVASVVVSKSAIPSKIQSKFKTYFQSLPGKNGSTVCCGADLLGVVSTPNASIFGGSILQINGIIGSILVTPLGSVFLNTRLYVEALRYEKFRFRKLRFHFLSDVGTNVNGSVILAYDPDPADNSINLQPDANSSLSSLQILMGFADAEKDSVWTPFSMDCRTVKNDPQEFYYTNYVGGDIRLAAQGSLWVADGGSLPNNTSLGSIAIEYEIEFWDPSMDQLNSQANYAKIGFATSLTANQGLNFLASTPSIAFTGGGKGTYPIGVDSAGNSFVSIPPGIHLVDYTGVCSSGGTPTAPKMTFSLVDNIVNVVASTISSLQSADSGASTTSSSFKQNKLIVAPGGTKLYGTLDPAFTGTAVNFGLKLIEWAASSLI